MRLALLITNTDESVFAQRHPKDAEKFSALLRRARPQWQFDAYSVKDGVFPETLAGIDGILVGGSPASVHDGSPWIPRLQALIQDSHAKGLPLFGACFGHQVIATALGGEVALNPDGWALGAVTTRFLSPQRQVAMYAAHKEQVTRLPTGARILAETPGCKIAGFAIENHVMCTQYHPEMTKAFISALLDELRDDLGAEITGPAQASLALPVDTDALAEWIAVFFERAQQGRL